MAAEASPAEIARVFRQEYGRAVAVLVRRFGDLDLAEEAVQDASRTACRGTPICPTGCAPCSPSCT